MKKTFYGFEYMDGENSRWAHSGRIAGHLFAFKSLEKLKKWIDKDDFYFGGKRKRVTVSEALKLVGKECFQEERSSAE